jgi:hypothetical protein
MHCSTAADPSSPTTGMPTSPSAIGLSSSSSAAAVSSSTGGTGLSLPIRHMTSFNDLHHYHHHFVLFNNPDDLPTSTDHDQHPCSILENVFESLEREIRFSFNKAGTCSLVIIVFGKFLWCANVGDCRGAYIALDDNAKPMMNPFGPVLASDSSVVATAGSGSTKRDVDLSLLVSRPVAKLNQPTLMTKFFNSIGSMFKSMLAPKRHNSIDTPVQSSSSSKAGTTAIPLSLSSSKNKVQRSKLTFLSSIPMTPESPPDGSRPSQPAATTSVKTTTAKITDQSRSSSYASVSPAVVWLRCVMKKNSFSVY